VSPALKDRTSRPPRHSPPGVHILPLHSDPPLPAGCASRLPRIRYTFPLAPTATMRPTCGLRSQRRWILVIHRFPTQQHQLLQLPEHHVPHLRPYLISRPPTYKHPLLKPNDTRARNNTTRPLPRRVPRAGTAPRRAALHQLFLHARALSRPPSPPAISRARPRAPLRHARPFLATPTPDLPATLRAPHAGRTLAPDIRHVPRVRRRRSARVSRAREHRDGRPR